MVVVLERLETLTAELKSSSRIKAHVIDMRTGTVTGMDVTM